MITGCLRQTQENVRGSGHAMPPACRLRRIPLGLVLLVENLAITPPLFSGFAAVKKSVRALSPSMFALWHGHSRLSPQIRKQGMFIGVRSRYLQCQNCRRIGRTVETPDLVIDRMQRGRLSTAPLHRSAMLQPRRRQD